MAVHLFALLLLASAAFPAEAQDYNNKFWPEVSVYVPVNDAARFLVLTKFSNSEDTRPWQADFGSALRFCRKARLQA